MPSYIERVARHLQAKGRTTSVAIATAVNHAKKMCGSGTAFGGKVKVSGKAQAVACKAVAEWEKKKASAHVKEADFEIASDDGLTIEEGLSLLAELQPKLILIEGYAMTLGDKAAGKTAKRQATANALKLLEGKAKLDWEDSNADFGLTHARLKAERGLLSAMVEGLTPLLALEGDARGDFNVLHRDGHKIGRYNLMHRHGQKLKGAPRGANPKNFPKKKVTAEDGSRVPASFYSKGPQSKPKKKKLKFGAVAEAYSCAGEHAAMKKSGKKKCPTCGTVFGKKISEAPLTSKGRNALAAGSFVFPKDRRYPIHDISHARNALARASGKPEEGKVRSAVYAKYPALRKKKVSEATHNPSYIATGRPLPGTSRPKTRTGGKARDPEFEKKHPRTPEGRTGGGMFITSGGGSPLAKAVGSAVGASKGTPFKKAVRQYQKQNDLTVDGIVGRQTAAALMGRKNASKVTIGAMSEEDRSKLKKKLVGSENTQEAAYETLADGVEIIREARAWAAEHAPQAYLSMRALEESIQRAIRSMPDAEWDARWHPRNRLKRFVDVPDFLEKDYRAGGLGSPVHRPVGAGRTLPRGRVERPGTGRVPALLSPGKPDKRPKVAGFATKGRGTGSSPKHTVFFDPRSGKWTHTRKTGDFAATNRYKTEHEARKAAGMRGGRKAEGAPEGFTISRSGKLPVPPQPRRVGEPRSDYMGSVSRSGGGEGGAERFGGNKPEMIEKMRQTQRRGQRTKRTVGPRTSKATLDRLEKVRAERGPGYTHMYHDYITQRLSEPRSKGRMIPSRTDASGRRPSTSEPRSPGAGTLAPSERKMARGYGVGYGNRFAPNPPQRPEPKKPDLARAYGVDPSQQATRTRPGSMLASPGMPDGFDPETAPLWQVARVIQGDWGGKVNFAAKPYLEAMSALHSERDMYGADRGAGIVAYFLSNSSAWKGDTARKVKAALRKRQKAGGPVGEPESPPMAELDASRRARLETMRATRIEPEEIGKHLTGPQNRVRKQMKKKFPNAVFSKEGQDMVMRTPGGQRRFGPGGRPVAVSEPQSPGMGGDRDLASTILGLDRRPQYTPGLGYGEGNLQGTDFNDHMIVDELIHGPMSTGALGDQTGVGGRRAAGRLKALERRGIVEKVSPAERRGVLDDEKTYGVGASSGSVYQLTEKARLSTMEPKKAGGALESPGYSVPRTGERAIFSDEERRMRRGYGIGYGQRFTPPATKKPAAKPRRKLDPARAYGIDPTAQTMDEPVGSLRSPGLGGFEDFMSDLKKDFGERASDAGLKVTDYDAPAPGLNNDKLWKVSAGGDDYQVRKVGSEGDDHVVQDPDGTSQAFKSKVDAINYLIQKHNAAASRPKEMSDVQKAIADANARAAGMPKMMKPGDRIPRDKWEKLSDAEKAGFKNMDIGPESPGFGSDAGDRAARRSSGFMDGGWKRDTFLGSTRLRWNGYVHGQAYQHGDDVIGEVQDYNPDYDSVTVRWHLDDDHPAMQDVLGDNPEMTGDQAEMIEVVPRSSLSDQFGNTLPKPSNVPESPGMADLTRVVDRFRSVDLSKSQGLNLPGSAPVTDRVQENISSMSTERLEALVRNPAADPGLRAAARRVLDQRRRGDSPLGEPASPGYDDYGEFEENPELYVENRLATLERWGDVRSTTSYEEGSYLTHNNGLVIRMKDGSEFQLTVVSTGRGPGGGFEFDEYSAEGTPEKKMVKLLRDWIEYDDEELDRELVRATTFADRGMLGWQHGVEMNMGDLGTFQVTIAQSARARPPDELASPGMREIRQRAREKVLKARAEAKRKNKIRDKEILAREYTNRYFEDLAARGIKLAEPKSRKVREAIQAKGRGGTKVADPAFEKKHPRMPMGRIGGGRWKIKAEHVEAEYATPQEAYDAGALPYAPDSGSTSERGNAEYWWADYQAEVAGRKAAASVSAVALGAAGALPKKRKRK